MRKDNEDIHYSPPKQRCFKGTVRSPKLHQSRVNHSGRSLALAVDQSGHLTREANNPLVLMTLKPSDKLDGLSSHQGYSLPS